jgi:protein-disulfide isomerase
MAITRENILFAALVSWTVVASGITVNSQLERRRDRAAARQAAKPVAVADWREVGSRGYATGPVNATATVVVFSDFQCPFCRRFSTTLDSLRREHPEVRIVERQFPLTMHAYAFDAAVAAECARDIGQYDGMRHSLFEHQTLVAEAQWGVLAHEAGIRDTAAIVKCVGDHRRADSVRVDVAAGEHIGVQGTPTILVNDSLFAGMIPLSELVARTGGLRRTTKN